MKKIPILPDQLTTAFARVLSLVQMPARAAEVLQLESLLERLEQTLCNISLPPNEVRPTVTDAIEAHARDNGLDTMGKALRVLRQIGGLLVPALAATDMPATVRPLWQQVPGVQPKPA